jgi:hypothetical protein
MQEYVCNQCEAIWDEDENGLVPSICLKHKNWYGYWTPDFDYAGVLGCPTCNEDAWEWHEGNREGDTVADVG